MPQPFNTATLVNLHSHATLSSEELGQIQYPAVAESLPRRKLPLPSEFALGESTDSLLLSTAALAALSAAGLGF